MADHDDAACARRRIWNFAPKDPLPKKTKYADAKGSDIEPGVFTGQYLPAPGWTAEVVHRKAVFPEDRY